MANEKYKLTFGDRLGNTWLLEIHEVGIINTPVAIKASGNPLTISYRSVNDLFEPVLVSEAVVELVSDSDLLYKTFFNSTRGKWKLIVYKNAVAYWTGQNMTENYSEPYILNPYTSQIKFSDLGDLDFIYYKNGASFYTGYKTLARVISDCVNKLAFSLNLTELMNVVLNAVFLSTIIVDKNCCIAHTSVDSRAFVQYKDFISEALTCMEVLKRIMKAMGCRMFQHNNRYYILRVEEAANVNGNIFAFDIDTSTLVVGAEYTLNILKTINNVPITGISPIEQNQDLTMSERYNQIIHKHITQETIRYNSELIYNFNFEKGIYTHNTTPNFPQHFAISSDLSSLLTCEVSTNSGDTKLFMTSNISPASFPLSIMPGFRNAQGDTSKAIHLSANFNKFYLKSTSTIADMPLSNIECVTADNLRIRVSGLITKSVNYVYMNQNNMSFQTAAGVAFWFGFYIKLTYNNGAVYYLKSGSIPPYTGSSWVQNTPNVFSKYVLTPSYSSNAQVTLGHVDPFEIEIDSANFPQDGTATFEVRLYIPRCMTPFTLPFALLEVLFDEFSIKYVTDGDFADDIITNSSVITLTSPKENIYNYDVYLGDGPTNFVLNTFRFPSVMPTYPLLADKMSTLTGFSPVDFTWWRKLNDATLKKAKDIFIFTPVNKMLSEYQRKIKGSYIGDFGMLHALEINDGIQTKRYILLGDSYDVKSSIHSVDMQEITSSNNLALVTVLNAGPKNKTPPLNPFPNSVIAVPFTTSANSMVINNPSSMPAIINNNTNYPS